MIRFLSFVLSIQMVVSGPATESYKDQFCTDPRTMRKHNAYTEWADAYSCTRHRCQPGGRNLAIYTVGCKRVEAPESAIECEEVVEDTNMQFPFCCTRLRCLVVVRGEVWTRVLGQPWEALPAAPWSHMYKMKRPPPSDTSFLQKSPEAGPVYELAEPEKSKATLRSKGGEAECNDPPTPNAQPVPDIVIALSTKNDERDHRKEGRQVPRYLALSDGSTSTHRRSRKSRTTTAAPVYEESEHEADAALDIEDFPAAVTTEKVLPVKSESDTSDEKYLPNSFGVTQKILTSDPPKHEPWSDIPNNQWNEHDPSDSDSKLNVERDEALSLPDFPKEATEPPPSNLQALVDAIGTRMRDIESVVQRMSDKVHDAVPEGAISADKRIPSDGENPTKQRVQAKKTSPDSENYKRFSVRNRSSKYLHTTESTTDVPLFVEDTNMNGGYFSDASNSVLRRAMPKEPAQTYMAPVETRRKQSSDVEEEEADKKHKKHAHKKKKSKHPHKKHHKDDKRKRFNKFSAEIEKNVVSLEDSRQSGKV